jgi:uncharacterized protein DUF6059
LLWIAWIRDRDEAPTARPASRALAARCIPALLARLLRSALPMVLHGMPAAALICPGHMACTVQGLEDSPARLPNPPGPAPGHPERLAAAALLTPDEVLWLAELDGAAR